MIATHLETVFAGVIDILPVTRVSVIAALGRLDIYKLDFLILA